MAFEPTLEQLLLYVRRRLSEDTMRQVHDHLQEGCSHCQERLAWVENLDRTLKDDPAVDLPEVMSHVSDRIYTDFIRRRSETDPAVVHAMMTYDSAWVPAPEGMRSPAYGQRRLLFRAGPYSIDLEISRLRRGTYDLLGQILPYDKLPPDSCLVLHRRPRRVAQIEGLGLFSLKKVSKGPAQLTLQLGDRVVKLTDVLIA